MKYVLCRYQNSWAIFDTVSKVYYLGKKKNLIERLKELNK